MAVHWKSDFDKFVVLANFERRGWVGSETLEECDVYWANVSTVKSLFGSESTVKLQPGQLINHFPNHYELTRKDLMVKNIKRYQKQLKKEGANTEALDFVPSTYALPQDYALFVEEFRRNPSTTWIMKPSNKAQGRGIFLINKLSQVKKWSSNGIPAPLALKTAADTYVVSRYLDNPLLIGGKKFDLRLYVVVPSYKPLRAYLSRLGFARFCNVKYSTEVAELDNMFVHLTNVAIQKHGDEYNPDHGNKWLISDLRLYLEAVKGPEATAKLFLDIELVIIHSLKACQNIMINDKHCFELYGYDIIIDAALKPWLIEVNASPSLTTTTKTDRLLKYKVISDTLDIVTPRGWREPPTAAAAGDAAADRNPTQVGSFHLIYDEAREAESERHLRDVTPSGGGQRHGRQTVLDVFERPRSAT